MQDKLYVAEPTLLRLGILSSIVARGLLTRHTYDYSRARGG
jgi:hypothetical protein